MAPDDPFRAHVIRLLDWQDAHVTFDAAVEGMPRDLRSRRPERSPHSAWELVEHMRLTQWDILDFSVNPSYEERAWPADYWPEANEAPTDGEWEESLERFRADREALKRLAAEADLLATIPHGSGQTYLRELVLVADHNAYHVGQLVLVRRLLGAWTTA
jgi:hypothetical protein